ncbi:YIPF4 isoform 4, partial [Pan troglodytes]
PVLLVVGSFEVVSTLIKVRSTRGTGLLEVRI